MVYLGDGSGIAVMPSVPILVVCITNLILCEIYICFRLLWAHLDPLSYYIVIGCVEYPGWGYY